MKKRFKKVFMVFLAVFHLIVGKAQVVGEKTSFRIVGYYPLRSALTEPSGNVPFNDVTHLNLWFLNPDSTGHFAGDYAALGPFVDAAHAKEVKVLASIGGGSSHPYYHELLKADKRAGFIDQLLAVVQKSNLDGIDVDLEGSDIDSNYESFVVELAAALKAQNKLITAAVAVYYKDALSDKALAQYDFVSIMSYDRTGPWRPEKPGPHATYQHAAEDLAYFGVSRSLPKEKMVLGVPFYGYGFGPEPTSKAVSLNYNEIVQQFPGAERADEWKMEYGKIIYYNSVDKIKQKTALAKEKASGIMIWQIKGDASGKHSLLKAINKVAERQ